jgi:hypothetical protein
VGATFAIQQVHISTCAGWLVASLFPKYSENGRKMRDMLSVACSAGLSVAFGAPIGGVLFSYEASNYLIFLTPLTAFGQKISTYFPTKYCGARFFAR